mgnify:CR=1 FL=1
MAFFPLLITVFWIYRHFREKMEKRALEDHLVKTEERWVKTLKFADGNWGFHWLSYTRSLLFKWWAAPTVGWINIHPIDSTILLYEIMDSVICLANGHAQLPCILSQYASAHTVWNKTRLKSLKWVFLQERTRYRQIFTKTHLKVPKEITRKLI